METDELCFVQAVHCVELEDGPVDVIELDDGRVLAISKDLVTLFENLDSLLDGEDEDSSENRPVIVL